MKQRDLVSMTQAEAASFLAAGRKMQLATNGPDGYPHLVTMYYALIGGRIAFWTYRKSQKARNLERDPRVSCLVETGEQYFDLRGALVHGTARRIEDQAQIMEVGRRITAALAGADGSGGPAPADSVADYLARAASKRFAYAVEPSRVISWDHTKLSPPG